MAPVKLFVGVLVSDCALFVDVEEQLVDAFGPIDHSSERLPFEESDYYSGEMGDLIDRKFFSFENLIEADALASIKIQTNQLEQSYINKAHEVSRPVNLDPGYVEQPKVVLASTKNFYHRIYMSQGVFAEVTMHFRNNTYQFFPWTYPEYKKIDCQEFFLRMRQIYRTQLKNQCMFGQEGDEIRSHD